jgi:hypothetical protein
MITRTDFAAIDQEVINSLNNALDHIRGTYPENYILFLAEGEYKPTYENQRFNPNVIDNREDKYKDETRIRFFVQFLQTFYTFPAGTEQTDDNEQRIHMELMVYSHIWEADPFLKKLFRLASIFNGQPYPWQVNIPPMGKHNFIRNDIRDVFRQQGHPLDGVITNGFHSSIRNAFAHSQYSFDERGRRIWFDNYNGEVWELENIGYNDWSRRFVYSALLGYYLVRISHDRRSRLIEEFGTDTFTIDHPSRTGGTNRVNIHYRAQYDSFNFVQ